MGKQFIGCQAAVAVFTMTFIGGCSWKEFGDEFDQGDADIIAEKCHAPRTLVKAHNGTARVYQDPRIPVDAVVCVATKLIDKIGVKRISYVAPTQNLQKVSNAQTH